MSAQFIVTYAGAPVRFSATLAVELVQEHEATPYVDEAQAWHAAFKAGLSATRVRVVSRHGVNAENVQP